MIFSLLKSGAQTILVIGVSPISSSAQMTFDELKREFKTNIKHVRVNIANEEEMSILDECLDKMPPVAGVINSAGVLDDKEFHNVTRDAYRRVMGPKINGKIFFVAVARMSIFYMSYIERKINLHRKCNCCWLGKKCV